MVRRRGVYKVNVLGKALACLFCAETTFRHREVYVKVVNFDEGVRKKKLTLQSLTCTKCGQSVKFEEQKRDGICNIQYIEVNE
jgi:transcription elongation factor Elf1